MPKSYFSVSTILSAFGCYCAEGLNEGGVLGAVHYVGGSVCSYINKLGCLVGVEVGIEVGALAYCGACRFDGVVAEVGALIVCEVVGFFYLAREGEAEPLFAVLSVVLVGSFEVLAECDVCHFGEFLSRSFCIYYTIFPGFCQGVFEKFFKNFFVEEWFIPLFYIDRIGHLSQVLSRG